MKPLIILSIIVVLCGAGCQAEPKMPTEMESLQYRVKQLEKVVAGGIGVADSYQPLTEQMRELNQKTMVTVQLKTPTKEECGYPAYPCKDGVITKTTTQIPLQEFVDLLGFKYVTATSTTQTEPAKLESPTTTMLYYINDKACLKPENKAVWVNGYWVPCETIRMMRSDATSTTSNQPAKLVK